MLAKAELLYQLDHAKNNYILGLAGLSLFTIPAALELLEKNTAEFGGYTINFSQAAKLLANSAHRDIAVKEYLTMLMRACANRRHP